MLKQKTGFLPGTILIAGLVAGGLDIIAASIKFYLDTGRGPDEVLRFVASGYFGMEAFTAGNEMIIWGLFFHFLVAISWAAVYWLSFRLFRWNLQRPLLAGIAFGALIWVVMNLVVLPASRAPKLPIDITNSLIGAFIIISCVGWPIAGIFSSRSRVNN